MLTTSLKHILLLAVGAAIVSCEIAEPKNESSDHITVPLNLSDGYIINPFTKDSVPVIKTKDGDTVITGVQTSELPASQDTIEILPPSKTIIVPDDTGLLEEKNKICPEITEKFLVDFNSLEKKKLGTKGDSTFYLISSKNDTVSSGIPFKITPTLIDAEEVPIVKTEDPKQIKPKQKTKE